MTFRPYWTPRTLIPKQPRPAARPVDPSIPRPSDCSLALPHRNAGPARPAHARYKMMQRLMNSTNHRYHPSRRISVCRFDGTVSFTELDYFFHFQPMVTPMSYFLLFFLSLLPSDVSYSTLHPHRLLLQSSQQQSSPYNFSTSNTYSHTVSSRILYFRNACCRVGWRNSSGFSRVSLVGTFNCTSGTSSNLDGEGSRYSVIIIFTLGC